MLSCDVSVAQRLNTQTRHGSGIVVHHSSRDHRRWHHAKEYIVEVLVGTEAQIFADGARTRVTGHSTRKPGAEGHYAIAAWFYILDRKMPGSISIGNIGDVL